MLKVTNKNSLRMYEMNSKLTLKTPGWRHQHGSGVCVINDEQMSHLIFLFLLLNFEKVIALPDSKVNNLYKLLQYMKKK